MATQPHPPAAPYIETDPDKLKQAYIEKELELQKKQANPVETIGDEQRKRSEEMEKMGVENWVKAHDERPDDLKPQSVPGVEAKDGPHRSAKS